MTVGLDYITCVASADRAALLAALDRLGAAVVVLDGAKVTDRASLFGAVASQLGLEPDMHPHGWDALTDALFEVVVRAGGSPVALIWDHADVLAASDLQDLLTAASVLESVAISTRRSRDIDSYAFLLGATNAFRPITAYTELS